MASSVHIKNYQWEDQNYVLHVFKAKGYLEAIQISKVEIFCENSQQLLTIWAKISILDVFLGSEFVSENQL